MTSGLQKMDYNNLLWYICFCDFVSFTLNQVCESVLQAKCKMTFWKLEKKYGSYGLSEVKIETANFIQFWPALLKQP